MSAGTRNSWWLLIAFTGLYVLAAECGHWLSFLPKNFASFWPPSGLFLFTLIRTPYRMWPQIITAALVADQISDVMLHGFSVGMSAGFWFANSIEASLGAFLFRRWCGARSDLADFPQLIALVVASVIISPACSAVIGTTVVKLVDPAISFSTLWFSWWLSASFGVLVIAPVLLTMTSEYTPEGQRPPWRGWLEAFLIFGCVLLVGTIAFRRPVEILATVPIRPFITFLLLIWAAFRFSLRGAACGALLLAVIAVWHTTHGIGPFVTKNFFQTAKVLQFFILACFLTALPLGIAVETRRRLTQALAAKARTLQLALDEIKTLRGILPICAHCKKIRTDEGEWERIELFLKQRTHADFSHAICPACADEHWPEFGVPENKP